MDQDSSSSCRPGRCGADDGEHPSRAARRQVIESGATVDVVVTMFQGGAAVITVRHRPLHTLLLCGEGDFAFPIDRPVDHPRTQALIDDVAREGGGSVPRHLITAAIEKARLLAFFGEVTA